MTEGQRGSALVIAILIAVILTLLGVSFLMMAETENRIASNERHAAQALYAAEAGARAVRSWFDRPETGLGFPPLAVVDRSLRRIDEDGAGPGVEQAATQGDPNWPWYKDGVDLDLDGFEDLFDRPYRDGREHMLLGTEDGPDLRIDPEFSSAAEDYLEQLSEALFQDSIDSGLVARISRVDVYGPPYLERNGTWTRYGMGRVRVTAEIHPVEFPERTLARETLDAVLNEVPYRRPFGPLHSCGDLTFEPELTVHWGAVTAQGNATLPASLADIPLGLPHSLPGNPRVGPLWDDGWQEDFALYQGVLGDPLYDSNVEDPWLRVLIGGAISGISGTQPYASPWEVWIDGDPTPDCCDHSNLFQGMAFVGCPVYDYDTWKMIAESDGSGVHLYIWDGGDSFRENGTGPARTFAEITDDREGIFFFDTRDGQPPTDGDDNGTYDNLTPAISVTGIWAFKGMIYLNAESLQINAAPRATIAGETVTLRPPGEPCRDADADGEHDPGEAWLDLDYPTGLGDLFEVVDEVTPLWDADGPPITAASSMWGILFTNGVYEATGQARHYGSVLARTGIVQNSGTAGTPDFYWDARIGRQWPPEGWNLPRVVLTRRR